MSAHGLLAELQAAGVRLARDGDDLVAEIHPGASLAPYRERILAQKPALLAALGANVMTDAALEWRHVFQGPVDATVPPPGWDGTICRGCRWPEFCRVLGPRDASLPGGPCHVYRPTWFEVPHGD